MKTKLTVARIVLGAASLLGALVLAAAAAGGGASVPAGNLIVNGGAEQGAGASGPTRLDQVVAPPGWTAAGNVTVVAYQGGEDAAGDFPPPDFGASIHGGKNFFAGGPGGSDTSMSQSIDLSRAAGEIDAGTVTAKLSGDLGGNWSQPDYTTVDAFFLDASGNAVGTLHLDGPKADDPGADLLHSPLVAVNASGAVPKGTRSVQVTATFHDVDGSWNAGYADNLSLQLSAPAGHAAAEPSLAVKCGGSKDSAAISPASNVRSVAFSVGKLHKTVAHAPFTFAFARKGLPKHATVHAKVTLSAGGSVRLSKGLPC
jgi:hypothetical protein